MKIFSTDYAAMLADGVCTLAVCWRISKNDGTFVYGTQHDNDIVIASGAYTGSYSANAGVSGTNMKRKADNSVDDMQVEGAFPQDGDTVTIDITHDDIVAGSFDLAPVVVFMVNWQEPNDYQHVLGWGTLGEITEDSTGHYTTDVRGPTQAFAQYVIRTQGDSCDIDHLGHGRCKFDVAGATVSGAVIAVSDRTTFQVSGIGTPAWSYARGLLTFTSGANEGLKFDVKTDPRTSKPTGNLVLVDEAPEDIQVGDTFTLEPGCARTLDACKVFGQVENMQAMGLYVPGIDALMQGYQYQAQAGVEI